MLIAFIIKTIFGAEIAEFWNATIRPFVEKNAWDWILTTLEFTATFWGGVVVTLILILVIERTLAKLAGRTLNPSVKARLETRLRIRVDPNGTAIEEINKNTIWQQTIWGVDTISNGTEDNSGQVFRGDTISIAFTEPIDYERPIVETFGHSAKLYGSYPLGRNGHVFVFVEGLPPVVDIYFPEPGYYEQNTNENITKSSPVVSAEIRKNSESNSTKLADVSPSDEGDNTDNLAWNFDKNKHVIGCSMPKDKVLVHQFQGMATNNTKEPLVDFKGYVRSDRTGKTFPTLFNLAGEMHEPNNLEPIPAGALIDTHTYFSPDKQPIELQTFFDEIAPITFFFEYNGNTYSRHFSIEEMKPPIEEYEKGIRESRIKPPTMSAISKC